jgi:hypothetical protein
MDKFLLLFGQVILESSFADLALQLSPVLCCPQLSLSRSPKLSRIQVHIYSISLGEYVKKNFTASETLQRVNLFGHMKYDINILFQLGK